MKKIKRTLAVFIAVLMLAAAIPMNALAATLVKTIDLTVAIEPGTMMEDYEDYIIINSPGLEFADFYDPPIDISEIHDEEYYWPSTDYFDYGYEYEILILLTAKSGYSVPESKSQMESVTVNGEEAYFEIETFFDENGDEVNTFVVYAPVIMEKTVSNVELTVNPVADYYIGDYYRYVSINCLGVMFEETLDSGVLVTDSLGGDPFNYFVADEEYTLKICLTPAFGCEFAKDEDGNIALDNVTVNGEAAEYTAHIEADRGYIEYITITVTTVPETKKVIDVIDITIAEDLKGYAVEDYNDYITIETEGVSFDKYDPYAVWAYDSDFNSVYTFDGGDYYYIGLNFITDEGYFFSPDGVVIIINGEEYDYVSYDTYYPEGDLAVEYIYTEYSTDFVGNVFDMIIAWFRDIFEAINQFLFGWIYY